MGRGKLFTMKPNESGNYGLQDRGKPWVRNTSEQSEEEMLASI
jgi:hypothetical protein